MSLQDALLLSMIGMTHYLDSIHNIQEKLWTLGINFIKVKAITRHKFLLLFSDQDAFDNFDSTMVHPLFHSVKYTDSKDLITMRIAKLQILGLPIYSWNAGVLGLITKK